jgi:hypothetical protein
VELHGVALELLRLKFRQRHIAGQRRQAGEVAPVGGDGVRAGAPLMGQLGEEGVDRGVGGHAGL